MRLNRPVRRGRISLGNGVGLGMQPLASGTPFTPLSLSPALWLKADAGLVTDGAAQFTAASSQWLSKADNASFTWGGGSALSVSYWIYFDSIDGISHVAQRNYGTDTSWVVLDYTNQAFFSPATSPTDLGTTQAYTTASVFTATGTWYHVAWVFDGTQTGNANRAKCWINGVQKTLGFAGTIPATLLDSASPLTLGRSLGASAYLNGRLDNVRIWSRAITSDEVASEYASGAGRNYAAMSTSDKVSLVCAYDFASPGSGLVADSHGSNTLTNNNTVTYAAGIVSGTASADGDPVTTWQDLSGNARHASAATSAKRTTLKLAIQNGMPALLWDGVDDALLTSAFQSFPSKRGSLFIVYRNVYPTSYSGVLATFPAASPGWYWYSTTSGANAYKWYDGSAPFTVPDLDTTTWQIQSLIRDSDTSLKYRRSGTAITTLTIANNQPASGVIGIGADGSGAATYQGYIGEILLFDTAISGTDLANVEAYLNARWGVY